MRLFCKVFIFKLVLVLTLGLAGCGSKETSNLNGDGRIPKSLTIFAPIGSYAIKAGANDNNDMLPYQLMEELTGCHVEWIHPASGAQDEKFNLLITSGSIPDMMVYNWKNVPGGAKLYVEDEIIVPLHGLIEKDMPYLSTFLKGRPEIAKQIMDDDGGIYHMPFVRADAELKVYAGPQIRQDWLDKLGLEVPRTTDELYDVLKAFKTLGPDIKPMSGVLFENHSHGIGNLVWAFGTHYDFYVADGEVKYGIMEDRFEEALAYVAKLHKDGLIDVDYLLNDRDKMDGKVMNNQVGFVYSLQPGKFYTSMNDGERKVIGIPHLTGPYGDQNCFFPDYANDTTKVSIAITTANKNPEGSAKWLDNFFGGKGLEYMNFGKEGLTFEWVDGYPKLTDYILNNPDGKSIQDMAGINLGAYQSQFPTLQDWRYYEQILSDWGKESIKIWQKDADASGILPTITFTEEESQKVTQIMSQIQTYVSETMNKIVIGQASISELPQRRERIKTMGIDEVLKIYNEALKRYINR
ncbi:MAG: extracellular solute-binding protein [Firmicutes bacterium]|nr:extracellular solute-binding protein [Bacillota bacterium]